MADWEDAERKPDDWRSAEGEAGAPGPDPYAPGKTEAQRTQANTTPKGTLKDAAISWADTAALGAGPQIAGVIGAFANAAQPHWTGAGDIDVYRDVRDETEKQIDAAERTSMGQAVKPLGVLSTPIPVKSLGPEAGMSAKAAQGAKVGGGVGFVHGAVNSKGDLTKMSTADLKRVVLDGLFEGVPGAVGGAMTGAAMAPVESQSRSVARKLPMDMLGVSEPARRSMQRQGIYDAAGDDLLSLVRPFRSGMRKGSLVEDALAELKARGESLDEAIGAVDAKMGGKTVNPGSMGVSVLRGAKPFVNGSLQDQQVASRMGKEAESMIDKLGPDPISLADAERFKQRFGPAVAKELRHAGEPAAKTTALADTYRALKTANEAAAANASPELAKKFMDAKAAYSRMAAPLEGASVERSGLQASDFDLGDLVTPPPAEGPVAKVLNSIPLAGPLVTQGANLVGRAYGRGAAANIAEFLANRMANNTGGATGAAMSRAAMDPLRAKWGRFLEPEEADNE